MKGGRERPASPLVCHGQEQLQIKTSGLRPTAVAKLVEKLELPGVRHGGSLSQPVLMDLLTHLWLRVAELVLVGPCTALL